MSEVGKHFKIELNVLQVVLNTGSVLTKVAVTCLSVVISP